MASLRDYEVQECLKNNHSIQLYTFRNGVEETMTLEPKQLHKGIATTHSRHVSRYGTKSYKLVDFKWKKDNEEAKQAELFS